MKRRFEISDPKALADVEDNFRKTISQLIASAVTLLGGAAVLIGTWLAYSGTQQTIEASRKQAGDQLISQQVSKGFELLGQAGNDKKVVRLGGIYALEAVMNTSKEVSSAGA